jgi:hypothetical protein
MLDGKEAKNVIQRFNELDKLITDLQTEFSSVKKKYLEPEYPEQRRQRWKTAPTC